MRERPDSLQTLAEMFVPLLILHGADDQLMPVDVAKEMQAANPAAGLEIVPDAGHLLNLEQPERFNAAVRSFLKQL
jgi:pimeloyl-ACP methyl ester carboxylesterase